MRKSSRIKCACDWCGKEFSIYRKQYEKSRQHFCSQECYCHVLSKRNQEVNKTLMTPQVKEKLRQAHLNSGEGKTYTKRFSQHEHRAIAEKILGRPLAKEEIVHHINGDKRDNKPENLALFPNQAEHARYHMLLRYGKEVSLNEVHATRLSGQSN